MRSYRSHLRGDLRGSQLAWEDRYRPDLKQYANNGPHHFNPGDIVRRGMNYGRVLYRTALTAAIRWDDKTVEVIDQFDTEVSKW